MKTTIIILVASVITLYACDSSGWDYPFNKPRSKVLIPDHTVGYTPDSSNVKPSISPDTVTMIVSVQMPDDYDWNRDSAIGLGAGKLILYRNMEEILSFPTGYKENVSTDYDTHHLIGGHLYTEYSSSSRTYIKRDGEPLFDFEGREYLTGMLVREGRIYTLSMNRHGNGFTYRVDGNVLFSKHSGIPYGSIQDISYPASGALYEDSGSIWFAYHDSNGGSFSEHIVKNGKDSLIVGGPFDDVRVIGGELHCISKLTDSGIQHISGTAAPSVTGNSFKWTSCSLFNADGNAFVVGNATSRYGGNNYFVVMGIVSMETSIYKDEDYMLYHNGGSVKAVPASYEGYYKLQKPCYSCLFGEEFLALTPYSRENPTLLRKNGKDEKIEVEGYVSAIEILVIPPN